MSRWKLLLLIIILPLTSVGRSNYYDYFNSEAFWSRLVIDQQLDAVQLLESDTVIIVASNRMPSAGSLRFMAEGRDKDSVRYFVVYARSPYWHVYKAASLRAAVALLPAKEKDWVVYTEGMGKIFTTNLDRGLAMASMYGVNVLLMDYPSIRTDYKGYRNYKYVMRHSNTCHRDFAPVLDSLRTLREHGAAGKGTLNLFFHSMGNNVIRRIAYSDALKRYNTSVWVDNVVLNAPCVPRRKAGDWIDRMQFAKRVFVHYNPYDNTLKWARIVSFHGILGERPKRQDSKQARYINFNQLCGDGHSNFLNLYGRTSAKQAAIAHYSKLLHGKDVEMKGSSFYQQQKNIVGWYITSGESISKN